MKKINPFFVFKDLNFNDPPPSVRLNFYISNGFNLNHYFLTIFPANLFFILQYLVLKVKIVVFMLFNMRFLISYRKIVRDIYIKRDTFNLSAQVILKYL